MTAGIPSASWWLRRRVWCVWNPEMGKRNRPGFTLVEVLVAAVLLAVGISAGVRTPGVMDRSSAGAADRETAVGLVGERLATLEGVDGVHAGDSQGVFQTEPRFHWQQHVGTASQIG